MQMQMQMPPLLYGAGRREVLSETGRVAACACRLFMDGMDDGEPFSLTRRAAVGGIHLVVLPHTPTRHSSVSL